MTTARLELAEGELHSSTHNYPLTRAGVRPSVSKHFYDRYNLNAVRNILMILQFCRTGHDDVSRC